MAKMFYTLSEVCEKLGKTEEEVEAMVASQEIEEFRDGDNLVFKVEQIELLKPERAEDLDLDLDTQGLGLGDSFTLGGSSSGSIGLAESQSAELSAKDASAPDLSAHAESGSALELGESSSMASGPAMPKDDLDLSAEMDVPDSADDASASLSAFDGAAIGMDEAGDTQLGEGLDDDLTLESVGSGSGLLDLTRESDDTSLGAELLEEVYSSDEEADFPAATGLFEAAADEGSSDEAPQAVASAPAAAAAPQLVTATQGWDPTWSGLSAGMLMGGLVSLMAVFAIVVVEVMGSASGIAQIMADQFWIWVGSLGGGTVILGVIGWVIGGKTG